MRRSLNQRLWQAGLFVLILVAASCSPKPALPSGTAAPTPLPAFTTVPNPAAGMLFVDTGQDLGPISPLVFGSNYGPWLFVTLDIRPLAIDGRISYLRFPGGNWGDLNDLDEWSIDQYIALCKEMNSTPSISVRLKGGTPEKAAELVRLVNLTKGYAVKYWSIGNEPSLYSDYTVEQYNQEWRTFATQMKAVDPTIVLVGPDTHQFTANLAANPKDKNGKDWMAEFLKANGDMVDVVSMHRYPFPPNATAGAPSIDDLRQNSREWDQIIPTLRALIREQTGRDLPVAVTEVNSSWSNSSGGDATPDSFYNAIWWGDSLGRMINQNTMIVAQFDIVGEFGLFSKYEPHPIYYVYQLYKRYGTQRLYASSDNPDLSIFAAKTADGALTLMVTNLAPDAILYPITIKGTNLSGPADVWRLDVTHKAEKIDSLNIKNGQPLSIPGQSMTLYIFPTP